MEKEKKIEDIKNEIAAEKAERERKKEKSTGVIFLNLRRHMMYRLYLEWMRKNIEISTYQN